MTITTEILPEIIKNDIADIVKNFLHSQFTTNIKKIIPGYVLDVTK